MQYSNNVVITSFSPIQNRHALSSDPNARTELNYALVKTSWSTQLFSASPNRPYNGQKMGSNTRLQETAPQKSNPPLTTLRFRSSMLQCYRSPVWQFTIRGSLFRSAKREDSGSYALTLENPSGTTSVTVKCKVLDVPSAPEKPTKFSNVLADKLKLSWNPPMYDGGSPVTSYVVERYWFLWEYYFSILITTIFSYFPRYLTHYTSLPVPINCVASTSIFLCFDSNVFKNISGLIWLVL